MQNGVANLTLMFQLTIIFSSGGVKPLGNERGDWYTKYDIWCHVVLLDDTSYEYSNKIFVMDGG